MVDPVGALLQHMRDSRGELERITRELSLLRERLAMEREKTLSRLANIERAIGDLKIQIAKPVEFKFSHLWQAAWIKMAFGIGMTIASMKLPDEAAARLFGLVKFLGAG